MRAKGVGPDAVVAVCADRSVALAVALLGVLAAGGAYLPLDPAGPAGRLRMIVEEADAVAALADPQYAGPLREADPGLAVLPMDAHDPADATAGQALAPAPDREPSVADLAYVIYTSGSTGRPKGVAVPHRGIVNRLLRMQHEYRLGPDDVVLQKTPYTSTCRSGSSSGP